MKQTTNTSFMHKEKKRILIHIQPYNHFLYYQKNLELYYKRDRRSLVVFIIITNKQTNQKTSTIWICTSFKTITFEKLSINNYWREKGPNLKEHFLLVIPLICAISSLSSSFPFSPSSSFLSR
jgi:hypothetical protein